MLRKVGPIHFFLEVSIVLTDIVAKHLTPGIFSYVLNDIGPIASKLAHFFYLLYALPGMRNFTTKNPSPPPVVNLRD